MLNKKAIDELIRDVSSRAEFEFTENWANMNKVALKDVQPAFVNIAQTMMKAAYVAGAQSAVLIILEKVAQQLLEDNEH